MPKTTRARTTGARAAPLQPKDANVAKKPAKAGAKKKAAATTENAPLKQANKVEHYILHVVLKYTEEPAINRILSVRSDLSFATLHEVLQIAFGWARCHAHGFEIRKVLPENEVLYTPYGDLILQLGTHGFLGESMPEPDKYKLETDYKLSDIYEVEEYKGNVVINYEYDYGDGWEHQIVLLGKEDGAVRRLYGVPDDMPAACIGGEGHACAEDCGSIPGWEDLKRVFKKGAKDPDGRKGWYKTFCANGDRKGLDPYKWDILEINDELQKFKVPNL